GCFRFFFFFFQAEDGIRDFHVTGVQTCALPIFGLVVRPDRRRGRGGGPPEPMAVRPFRDGRGPKLCAMAGGFGRPETKSIAMGDDENRLHVHGWSQTPDSSPWMACLPPDGLLPRSCGILGGCRRPE